MATLLEDLARAILPGRVYDFAASRLSYMDGEGSVLLMAGGLFIITFFLLGLMVRSAIRSDGVEGAYDRLSLPSVRVRVPTGGAGAPVSGSGGGGGGSARREGAGAPEGDRATLRRKGRVAGKHAAPRDLDDVLSRLEERGRGAPRIVASTPRSKRVRVYGCAGCAGAGTSGDGGGGESAAGAAGERLADQRLAMGEHPACAYEAGFLEGAFEGLLDRSVRVREVTCRGQGDDRCDFEVTY